jgi:hypothetical protein
MIKESVENTENEQGDSGFDYAKQILFWKKLNQLKQNIEKATKVHLDFWSQLEEANPDLIKLNQTGS